MKIINLTGNAEYAACCAQWIYDEFIKGIKTSRTYEDVLEAYRISFETELPVRLAAVYGGKCIWTVSLVHNDLRCRDYTPWLASLYVDKEHRGNKTGERLVLEIMNKAKDLGYKELYLRTEHASGYYKRLGWTFVERCEDDHGLVPDVFKHALV